MRKKFLHFFGGHSTVMKSGESGHKRNLHLHLKKTQVVTL